MHVPDLFSFPVESLFLDTQVPALPDGLLPEWSDVSALVLVGGALVGVLLLYVLLLLPFAVFGHGRAGDNARVLIGQIFGLFRMGIAAAAHRGDCAAAPGDVGRDGADTGRDTDRCDPGDRGHGEEHRGLDGGR